MIAYLKIVDLMSTILSNFRQEWKSPLKSHLYCFLWKKSIQKCCDLILLHPEPYSHNTQTTAPIKTVDNELSPRLFCNHRKCFPQFLSISPSLSSFCIMNWPWYKTKVNFLLRFLLISLMFPNMRSRNRKFYFSIVFLSLLKYVCLIWLLINFNK